MGDDEVLVALLSSLLGAGFLGEIYVRIALASSLGANPRLRLGLAALPPLALAGIWWVLRNLASFDVRESPPYLWQYLALGAAWLGIFLKIFAGFAVSWRDDVIERSNPAALWAVAGAASGLGAAYAGANVAPQRGGRLRRPRAACVVVGSGRASAMVGSASMASGTERA